MGIVARAIRGANLKFRNVYAGISAKTPALDILPLLHPGIGKVIFGVMERRRTPIAHPAGRRRENSFVK